MADPAVTAVIPCFNHGQFVERAVDSVLGQTYGTYASLLWTTVPLTHIPSRCCKPWTAPERWSCVNRMIMWLPREILGLE